MQYIQRYYLNNYFICWVNTKNCGCCHPALHLENTKMFCCTHNLGNQNFSHMYWSTTHTVCVAFILYNHWCHVYYLFFFKASPSNDCYCDFILMARELAIYLQDSSETFLKHHWKLLESCNLSIYVSFIVPYYAKGFSPINLLFGGRFCMLSSATLNIIFPILCQYHRQKNMQKLVLMCIKLPFTVRSLLFIICIQ